MNTGVLARLRARGNAQRDVRWAFAAVWLVFLGYPVAALLSSDKSAGAIAYGLAIIALFAGIYIAACIRVIPFRLDDPDHREAAVFLVVLVMVVAASVPVIGQAAMAMAPYLIALSVFGLGQRAGIAMVVAIVVVALLGPQVVPGWDFDGGIVTAILVSGGAMLVARNLQIREREREFAEHRKRELDEQLAVIAERERVARDVHDILGHSLTVITLKSELAGRLVDIDPDRAKVELAELHSLSRHALAEVRSTVGGLRTPDLRTELASARTALTAAEIEADLPTDLADLPPARSALFAWVVRESVTNVVRHSGARRCAVDVADGHIEVVDDGCGIDEHAFGNGLRGLTERVDAAGGALSVRATGTGTAVRVTVG